MSKAQVLPLITLQQLARQQQHSQCLKVKALIQGNRMAGTHDVGTCTDMCDTNNSLIFGTRSEIKVWKQKLSALLTKDISVQKSEDLPKKTSSSAQTVARLGPSKNLQTVLTMMNLQAMDKTIERQEEELDRLKEQEYNLKVSQ